MVTLDGMAETTSPAAPVALKVERLLGDLETYVCGQSTFGSARDHHFGSRLGGNSHAIS